MVWSTGVPILKVNMILLFHSYEELFPFFKFPYNAQRMNRSLMQFADNTGPDQPAHLCRLITACVVRTQN